MPLKKKSPAWYVLRGAHFVLTAQFARIFGHVHYRWVRRCRRRGLQKFGQTCVGLIMDSCRQAGVAPFLSFGTLLGYRRDGELIRWDSDLDFGLLEDGPADIPALTAAMAKNGFVLKADSRLTGPLAAIGKRAFISFIHHRYNVSMDIYFYHRWGDKIIYVDDNHIAYLYRDLLEASQVPKESVIGYALFYEKRYFREFKRAMFGASEVLLLSDMDDYLRETYGEWKAPRKAFEYQNVWAITAGSNGSGVQFVRLPATAPGGGGK